MPSHFIALIINQIKEEEQTTNQTWIEENLKASHRERKTDQKLPQGHTRDDDAWLCSEFVCRSIS